MIIPQKNVAIDFKTTGITDTQQYYVIICNNGTLVASLTITGRGTSPAPRNSRSTWGICPRLQHWSQLWRGYGRIDARHCGNRPDSGTE